MHAVEEKDSGDALAGEVEVIGSPEEPFRRPGVIDGRDMEAGIRRGDAIDERAQRRVGLADHSDRVLPIPPDHVDVEVGDDSLEGNGWVSDEP